MLCSDCYMRKVQLEVGEPLAELKSFSATEFNELKRSCGIPTSSYPVKQPESSSTPEPAPSCTSSLTGEPGDTTNSIAKSNSVSTDWLLTFNNQLPASINETFADRETICMDNVPKCILHQITSTETCSSLVKMSGTSVNEIMFSSWNPTVGSACRNLYAMVGKYICVSPPGQTAPFAPIDTTTISSRSAASSYTWTPAPDTATSSLNFTTTWDFPTEAIPIATATLTPPESAYASAVRARTSHCPFLGEDTEAWTEGLADDEYRLRPSDLGPGCVDAWDPYCFPVTTGSILPSPTDIASTCYPTVSTIIPDDFVKPPAPTNLGTSDHCNKWHVVGQGDTCAILESKYKISHASFKAWNPSLTDSCNNLRTQMAYCVRVWVEAIETPGPTSSLTTRVSVSPSSTSAGPPGPTQSGTSAACTKWHLHKQGMRYMYIHSVHVWDHCQPIPPAQPGCEHELLEPGYW
ncbi:hypothetical protein PTT_20167 [Pyrenophora teres f. teres 0-1]|uniref:LysM domain-containing protein n=1 Tax=Pyrenophora teres f. teres (strain 0-1) TaxID=861557 RepID=E3SAG6_PYRTT|nr:hypothetical protein PTT_20167 [Pyrenophora teres f. teres 0-1]